MNIKSSLRFGVVALAALVGPTLLTRAQEAPVDPERRPGEETPVVLSEFRVDTSRDAGYLATNSAAGTRLNTPIRDLPMQIEVMTRDFIEDIGAVDFKEAMLYSAGVVQDNVQGSNNFLFSPSGTGQATGFGEDSTVLNIRGFNTRFLLRNGFRLDTVADTVNVGRQELVRGPQALLYGVSALAGIVNVTPRYPTGRSSGVVRATAGSQDFLRFEGYYSNSAISSDGLTINYGIGAAATSQGSEIDFTERDRYLITPAFDFRIGRNTNLFLELEFGRFEVVGNGDQDFEVPNIGNVRNAAGLLAPSNQNIYRETLLVGLDDLGTGRNRRLTGGDTQDFADWFNATAQVSHKIGEKLELSAGANFNRTNSDFRTISASVQQVVNAAQPTSPGVWSDRGPSPLNPAQRVWRSMQYSWKNTTRDKEIMQTRLDAVYKFDLFGNEQTILVGRQDVQVVQESTDAAQIRNNAGVANSNSFKAYDASPFEYGAEEQRPFRDNKFWEWNTGHYVVGQSRWFDERLTAVAGYRWDRYHVRDLNFTYTKIDSTLGNEVIENWVRPEEPDNGGNSTPGSVPVVNGYRFGGKVQKDGNATYGANFRINDSISVFALSGSGIFPNTGQRDGAGNPFGAEKTKGLDAGLKLDLMRGSGEIPKISVQAGVYEVERENAVYNVFWAPQPRSNDRARPAGGGVPVGGYMAMGSGPNAYAVYSSGFNDFETSQPVTYLLPISYVAAADLNNPRVTGAPQNATHILVDYASLGTAANDPLRRAMDAAASDPLNFTALGTANVGSGATALRANNPYARNRNSDVAYNDRSYGFDMSMVLNLTRNYTATVGYSYIKQEVTGGFRVVDQPRGTEYDSWWNYMGIPLAERQALGGDRTGSVDFSGSAAGNRTIDAPIHQYTMWNRYRFDSGMLNGFTVGLGLIHRGERQSEIALDNGVRTRADGRVNQRFSPPYPSDTKVNAMVSYRTRVGDFPLTLQLNVNNLLDDQKDEALGTSTLFVNPATGATVDPSSFVGAQEITVPERARIYFTPISFRFSASLSF